MWIDVLNLFITFSSNLNQKQQKTKKNAISFYEWKTIKANALSEATKNNQSTF